MSSSDSPQLHNIFVYGSFQEPEVIHVMLDRIPEIVSATLHGFQRFRLKGRLYPCIIPSENGEVHGKVLMGLTNDELENVDWVEGNEYERVTVEVVRKDNSEKMTVETYPWINKNDPDIGGEWDFEEWKRLHMKKFIEAFTEIMERKRNPLGKGRDDFSHVLKEDDSGNAPSS
ncbi:Gamma-glutamyl cyclotransferase-like superfamily [Arabidopsis suecica]|uniref:Putative gamma-glutamylcyclotransferase n=1 Tax=Arabidopsis suecica TaxID=45249 RepID=A0A8T1YR10_ARASU|nr:Gamma-glutamyl cyclotransferase-like superfamily [Arabidopsis suecica]